MNFLDFAADHPFLAVIFTTQAALVLFALFDALKHSGEPPRTRPGDLKP